MEPELSTNTQTTAFCFLSGKCPLYTAPPGSAMARISSFFPRYIRRSVRSFWFSRIGRSLVRSLFSTFLAEASYADSQLFFCFCEGVLYTEPLFYHVMGCFKFHPIQFLRRRFWLLLPYPDPRFLILNPKGFLQYQVRFFICAFPFFLILFRNLDTVAFSSSGKAVSSTSDS